MNAKFPCLKQEDVFLPGDFMVIKPRLMKYVMVLEASIRRCFAQGLFIGGGLQDERDNKETFAPMDAFFPDPDVYNKKLSKLLLVTDALEHPYEQFGELVTPAVMPSAVLPPAALEGASRGRRGASGARRGWTSSSSRGASGSESSDDPSAGRVFRG
jgi:hypothetical protein